MKPFIAFAEHRAMRIAFWAKLDPGFVCEAWPKQSSLGWMDQYTTALATAWIPFVPGYR